MLGIPIITAAVILSPLVITTILMLRITGKVNQVKNLLVPLLYTNLILFVMKLQETN